ncbi:alpha-maltose-1-phosphate synthase [Microcystis aeruginosa NIES-1211]|jgi:glycosyltransferase involved in cell wall biosynthesis|uniref:Alpha-maltose-1-phosphate synthase n=1 Tax=Microcystis aeruginosa NIES-2519 TaxID=2303981 RepID=A0A5A5R1P0_MICAE|nr:MULTISPECIES: hormogonium polysaccharide biosynthesis glycosyltransferase HpsO [Microcystis]AVQ71057.1 glycosyl transferase family 1 [Microcystis sp. MC19]CCI32015.1 Glycosyl transferase group 1 [Microcystis sp. T1-4]GBL13304.1 alpha-maltose-1-phosphate synthase [Microcystis aeruginosa NIES-1211]GCA68498.1 alpha-maltose-1-phosphate synthase [Microcystis aeruginosa NIES-2519]GCA83537.1 alpha-maltose-1-phosphate synthase [Microcystis aeruginosa NIES-2522]
MRILVASHTYIVDLNCEKLRALTRLHPNLEVTIVVPQRWQPGGVQNKIIESQPKIADNFRVIPISNFSQNNQALLTFGTDIIPLLQKFRPDIIQVEQGSKSLAYAQFITLNRLLNLRAKNVFFTWWNLPYNLKFPISWLEAYNLKNTDGLIAGNQDGVDVLKERGYRGKYTVLPQLGVDEVLFSPSKQPDLARSLGIETDEFVIGFVGRFVEEKGILTLIKAVAKLTGNWRLLLLGRGILKDKIVSEAAAAGIRDRLIIAESVPHDQVVNYINLMNTLVLPSEITYRVKTLTAVGWKEQFGHVLIEAMACQIPVIGSDSGEIPFVIADTGLIFPEKDGEALAKSIQTLLDNPSFAQELGQRGYQRVMNNYTNKALAQKQLDFYQQLLPR